MSLLQTYDLASLIGHTFVLISLLAVLDWLLLRAEARGWINYRRNGLSRPGAIYHVLELQSVFDPGIRQVIEISYEERKIRDHAGDPLRGERGGTAGVR
jgi:hypothetical protein